jgi:hypothetical protein
LGLGSIGFSINKVVVESCVEFDDNDDSTDDSIDDSIDAAAAAAADDDDADDDDDDDDDEKHRIETRNFVENKPCLLIMFIARSHSFTNKLGRTLQLHPC